MRMTTSKINSDNLPTKQRLAQAISAARERMAFTQRVIDVLSGRPDVIEIVAYIATDHAIKKLEAGHVGNIDGVVQAAARLSEAARAIGRASE